MDGPLPPELIQRWGTYLDTYPQRQFTQVETIESIYTHPLLFPLQRRREAHKMLNIGARECPKVIMEIGADKGGSLYHWCLFPSVTTIIACEIRGTPYWREFNKAFPDIEFLWLQESSYNPLTVERVKRWLGKQTIDTLFIDGDKSYFDVDYKCYLPLMSRSGIIFFHDIQDSPGPRDAWLRCKEKHIHEEILDISEGLEAVERGKQGILPTSAHEGWLRYWAGRSCGVGVIHLGR